MERHFIPADLTIAELKRQVDDCEQQASKEPEPLASELREKAKLLRAWIEEFAFGQVDSLLPSCPMIVGKIPVSPITTNRLLDIPA